MAKVLIDIPEEIYNHTQEYEVGGFNQENDTKLFMAIKNGILLPDNATSGDVLKAIFPDAENIRVDNGLPLNFVLEFDLHRNYKNWWNSPYKASGTNKKIKTKEQVQATCDGAVFTLDEFFDKVEHGCFNSYDGLGYFHDGEVETDMCVWDNSLSWEDIKNMPYVCWYNK